MRFELPETEICGKFLRHGFCDLRFVRLSEKLEKAGTVDFKKHPARKVGTRSRQYGPKVSGRFAFPGARNPENCSISRSWKKFFQQFSRSFPGTFFLQNSCTDSGDSHSLLEFSEIGALIIGLFRGRPRKGDNFTSFRNEKSAQRGSFGADIPPKHLLRLFLALKLIFIF